MLSCFDITLWLNKCFFVGVVYICETQLYAVAFLNTLLSESILDMFTVPAMQIVQYKMCSFSTYLSFLELKLYAVTYEFLQFPLPLSPWH